MIDGRGVKKNIACQEKWNVIVNRTVDLIEKKTV